MKYLNIDRIVLAYLQGDATTNEIEMLRKWMRENEENMKIFNSIKAYWENNTPGIKSDDTDLAYEKLMNSIRKEHIDKTIDINRNSLRPNNGSLWLKLAAAVILIFSLSEIAYYFIRHSTDNQQTVAVREIIKENPKGQKLTTYLPDGSKVVLNSLSKIKYQVPFIAKNRIIVLEGEAFFEVKKDSLHPFKVKTNGVTTTALGTSFNVNYKHTDVVKVYLVTGKVKVEENIDDKFVILGPGNSTVVKKGKKMMIREFDYMENIGWKDGILTFNDDSFTQVIEKLEDWYGVGFIGDDKIMTRSKYTGMYKNETLEEVLQGISFVYNLQYKISGDTVKIVLN